MFTVRVGGTTTRYTARVGRECRVDGRYSAEYVARVFVDSDNDDDDDNDTRKQDNDGVRLHLTIPFCRVDGRFWIENGRAAVAEKVKYVNNVGTAKNIIMFLGDGMSLTTLTASRIYAGQTEKRSGENEYLSFERFPFVGMSKVVHEAN